VTSSVRFRATPQQIADLGCGGDDLFEVVEQEQHPLGPEVVGETILGADRGGNRRQDELLPGHTSQRHPEDAVEEIIRGFCG
jgi:hypothetical protein